MAGNISLGKAVLVLATEMGQWTTDLDKAEAQGERLADAVDGVGKGIKNFGKATTEVGKELSVGLTAPITAVVGGLTALAIKTAEAGDTIKANALAAGVSGTAYQELSYALGQVANFSQEKTDIALKNLTATIGEAATGSKKAQAALGELGFSQEQIASGSITTEEAFARMTAAMQAQESTAQAVALAGDLVGSKVGKNLAGALRESGAEIDVARQRFKDLGLGMSEAALTAGDDFNDALETVKLQFGALAKDIGEKVLPILANDLLPWITEKGIPMVRSFAQTIGSVIEWFGNLPAPVKGAIAVITALAAAIGPVLVVAGTFISAIGSIISVMSGVMPVISAVGVALAALGAGPLLAIVGAIGAVILAWKKWDVIVDIVDVVWQAIKKFVADTAKLLMIGGPLLNPIAGVVTLWKKWDQIEAIVLAVYTAVKTYLVDKFAAIVQSIKDKIAAVTGFFSDMYTKVVGQSYVPDMINGIASEFGRLDGVMVQPTSAATSSVNSLFSSMSSNVLTTANGFLGELGSTFEGWLTSIFGDNGLVKSLIHSGMEAIFGDDGLLLKILKRGLEIAVDLARDAASRIGGWLDKILKWLGPIAGLFGGGGGGTNLSLPDWAYNGGPGGGPPNVAPMAEGGYGRVRRPTLFLAGESGPEDYAFSGGNSGFGGGDPRMYDEMCALRRDINQLFLRLPSRISKANVTALSNT